MGSTHHTMTQVDPATALQISHTIHLMLQCMDLGTEQACHTFANLFTTEAEINIPLVKVTKRGYNELKSLCSSLHAKFSPCSHWEGNVVLSRLSESLISNRSYWKAIKSGQCISVGVHEDQFVFVEEENTWKCSRRVIKHTWTKEQGDIEQ